MEVAKAEKLASTRLAETASTDPKCRRKTSCANGTVNSPPKDRRGGLLRLHNLRLFTYRGLGGKKASRFGIEPHDRPGSFPRGETLRHPGLGSDLPELKQARALWQFNRFDESLLGAKPPDIPHLAGQSYRLSQGKF